MMMIMMIMMIDNICDVMCCDEGYDMIGIATMVIEMPSDDEYDEKHDDEYDDENDDEYDDEYDNEYDD